MVPPIYAKVGQTVTYEGELEGYGVEEVEGADDDAVLEEEEIFDGFGADLDADDE